MGNSNLNLAPKSLSIDWGNVGTDTIFFTESYVKPIMSAFSAIAGTDDYVKNAIFSDRYDISIKGELKSSMKFATKMSLFMSVPIELAENGIAIQQGRRTLGEAALDAGYDVMAAVAATGVGVAAGGFIGAKVGVALGSSLGPVGAIVGSVVGFVGGLIFCGGSIYLFEAIKEALFPSLVASEKSPGFDLLEPTTKESQDGYYNMR